MKQLLQQLDGMSADELQDQVTADSNIACARPVRKQVLANPWAAA